MDAEISRPAVTLALVVERVTGGEGTGSTPSPLPESKIRARGARVMTSDSSSPPARVGVTWEGS